MRGSPRGWLEHLRLAGWPSPVGVVLDEIETAVLADLMPPLNLDKVATPGHALVRSGRRHLADQARAWMNRWASDDHGYSIVAMSWGEVELEPEVRAWYLSLDEDNRARVQFNVDRLADMGPRLDEPLTKQLDGKLRELRFYLDGRPTRITYWIASGRRIILLTVFVKTQRRERREVERAKRAFERCLAEGHTVEEGED
jgi:hypothetical protein